MKTNWLIYTRGTIHLHRFANVLKAIADGLDANIYLYPVKNLLYINVGAKLWFAWDEQELKNYAKKVLGQAKDPKLFSRQAKQIEKYANSLIKFSEEAKNLNLKQLTNSQLVDHYSFLFKNIGPIQSMLGGEIDAVDYIFEGFLQEQLKQELNYSNNFNEVYKLLSVPCYTSYVSKQNLELMLAAIKKQNPIIAAKRIHKKYWWTNLGWENMSPQTVKYFEGRIKSFSKDKNLKQKIKETQKHGIDAKQNRKTLVKKYKLSPYFQYLLKVVDRYAYLHDLRKESQVRSTYALHLAMLEASKRLKLKPDNLEWLWYEEIQDLLKGKKFNPKISAERKKAICVTIINRKITELRGTAAIAERDRILKRQAGNHTEIKGLGVTNGVVRGTVKVCSGYKEALDKVKKGDILVTGMTLPDYVPAMRKAAGIVTDEGGITCHAAIVSRELKKVCIVGTKVATQLLKDGDLVEVDANQGIVKKL